MKILCFKKSAVFKNLETPSEQILTAQIFWPQDMKRFENAVFKKSCRFTKNLQLLRNV
jgi:hypothetical protein